MNAVLVPGQGSQTPGMLLPWVGLPGAQDDLRTWSDAAGLDLVQLGSVAGAEEIRDTAIAQPLLTATALLSSRALTSPAGVVCGHSVGELGALALAGVLTEVEAVSLAAERGRLMAKAAAERPTGMVATLGGDDVAAREVATELGLEVATVNVTGQTVYGGPVEALEAFATAAPGGARVRRLETAGAFHTSAMAAAVPGFASLVADLRPREASVPVIANADGSVLTDGRALLDRLVSQLTGPVRFDLCLQAIAMLGPEQVVELAPAGTLTALVKRALPGVPVLALKDPA
ncbi:MAG TPA: ACP S-malonyltransferase [Mycobacteriales bacterium]|nr:ACP S-malonyltransferase [Mycobacteriales bacterium]